MRRDDRRKGRSRRALAALAVAGLLIPRPARASLVDLVGVAFLGTWEAPPGREVKTIQGLTLVKRLPDREVTPILVELEGERQLVLSRENRALEGVSDLRLLNDETGWWVRPTERSTLKIDDIDDLGNISKWTEASFEADHVLSSTLQTAGGEEVSWTARMANTERRADFFEQMGAEGVTADPVEGMPGELDSAVGELASLLTTHRGQASPDRSSP